MHLRILINGEPNTRKTTSLLTLPSPRAILTCPGEHGHATLPQSVGDPATLRSQDPDTFVRHLWEGPGGKELSSGQTVDALERVALEIIAGKYGPIVSLAIDGFHKLMDHIVNDITGGAFYRGDEFEPRLYAPAYRRGNEVIQRLSKSNLPNLVFTSWATEKPDRRLKPGEKAGKDVPTRSRPSFIGQYAYTILGEFPFVFHQTLRKEGPTLPPRAMWQTRPSATVAGAGMKGPVAVIEQFPNFIPADFQQLLTLWEQYSQKVTA